MRTRQTIFIERFEYFCKACGSKGTVVDVLLNPEFLLMRGHCSACGIRGGYKAVDIARLRQEYDDLENVAGEVIN